MMGFMPVVRIDGKKVTQKMRTQFPDGFSMRSITKMFGFFYNLAETPFANSESQKWTSDRHRV